MSRIGSVCLLLSLLTACGGGDDGMRYTIGERVIRSEPGGIEDAPSLFDEHEIAAWRFSGGEFPAGWEGRDLEVEKSESEGMTLEGVGEDPRIVLMRPIDAAEVSVIEVGYRRFGRGRLCLSWEGSEGHGKLRLDAQVGGEDDVVYLFFEVGRVSRWAGTIDRLVLHLEPFIGSHVHLVSFRCLKRSYRSETLETARHRGLRVRLGDEYRIAVPALYDRPVVLKSPGAGRNGRVCFGYGTTRPYAGDFSVRWVAPGGGQLLWSASTEWSDGWRDVCTVLPPAVVGSGEIVLEASGGPPGALWWSDPRIEVSTNDPPPNLILIVLDTLRADALSSYGNPLPTTPFLDGLADSTAVLFENVVAPAPWTLPSHCSIFSGLNAIRHGVNHRRRAPDSLVFLAEILRERGYRTGAVTGGGILRPHFGFTQGFDRFSFWESTDSKDELETNIRRAERWIKDNRDRPFFLFFHTYEIHYPHRRRQPYFNRLERAAGVKFPRTRIRMLPPKVKGLVSLGNTFAAEEPGSDRWVSPLTPDQKALVRLMYDSAAAFADEEISGLFSVLDRLDLRRRTMVVITSDHGEALGENDRAGHSFLEDYNIKVPLIIEFPGEFHGGTRISDQVRSIDIMPTMLQTAGIGPPENIDGRSLLPLIEGRPDQVPRDAWSYAASSNRGLALRRGPEGGWVFNDAAWKRLWGNYGAFRPGEDIRAARKDRHWGIIRDAVRRSFGGLRVEIWNRGPGMFEGRLEGNWNERTKVKSGDAACACLAWKHGQGVFELGPGENLELLISGSWASPGGIEGRYIDGNRSVPLSLLFDRGRPREPSMSVLVDGRWRKGGPRDEGLAGISIDFRGPEPGGEASTELGAEARKQLEALGYVTTP